MSKSSAMRDFFRRHWMLLALVTTGAMLRMIFLSGIPPAIFRDEAEKACNAGSLLLTGRDLSGRLLPLFINVFGVTTSAIYQYAAIPFVSVFGLNEWGARLPAAMAGCATIIVNYYYMKRERGMATALWASLFLALSPWHIIFSRWAQQGIFLPLLLAGAMLSWRAFLGGSRHALPIAAVCFGMALYAYEVARLFVPAMLLLMSILYWRELRARWRETLPSVAILLLMAAPVISLMLSNHHSAQARFSKISIFQQGNSPAGIMLEFSRNYLSHLSPGFLLIRGDAELRHSAGVGMLTGAECAAAIAGIILLIKRRGRGDLLLLGWLALYPVPASLTREGVPHALRAIVAIPVIADVAACGMAWCVSLFPDRIQTAACKIGVLLQLAAFLPFAVSYFGSYAARSAFNWQYGVKQALQIGARLPADTNMVFYNVTGAKYLVAFYAKIPPGEIQKDYFAHSRYVFPPFNISPGLLCSKFTDSTAYVMPLPYDWPCAEKTIDIRAPGSFQTVMRMNLNKQRAGK
ncbi:MAG: glycosyltransferase family 39 protein [bacterium]